MSLWCEIKFSSSGANFCKKFPADNAVEINLYVSVLTGPCVYLGTHYDFPNIVIIKNA